MAYPNKESRALESEKNLLAVTRLPLTKQFGKCLARVKQVRAPSRPTKTLYFSQVLFFHSFLSNPVVLSSLRILSSSSTKKRASSSDGSSVAADPFLPGHCPLAANSLCTQPQLRSH